MKILLVDDDHAFVTRLRAVLDQAQYQVDVAFTGQQGLEFLAFASYELLLLDLQLPDTNGVQVCQRLRSRQDTTPILLLTASEAQTSKVRALDAGADDYLVKPFDTQELLARIRALLRRQSNTASPTLRWDTLALDPSLTRVSCDGKPLALTAKEYQLMELLLRNPQRIFSAQALLDRLWLLEDAPSETAVRTHMKGLRRKLKSAGQPDIIETVRGLGYRLREAPSLPPELVPELVPEAAPEPALNRPAQSSCHGASSGFAADMTGNMAGGITADIKAAWAIAQQEYLARIDRMDAVLVGYDSSHAISPKECKQALAILQREAHTLKGGLGSFGLEALSLLSRDIQQQAKALMSREAPTGWLLLQPMLSQLRQQLMQADQLTDAMMGELGYAEEHKESARLTSPSRDRSFRHWLVSTDAELRDRLSLYLAQLADPAIELCSHLPTPEALAENCRQLIWLDLEHCPDWSQANDCLQAIYGLPQVNVLGLAASDDLNSRIESQRRGGDRFALRSAPMEELWAIATDLLQLPASPLPLLVVDDDPGCLMLLERDLHDFSQMVSLTTLSEPSQFWEILEQVRPAALVLDAEMPAFSGVELCQAIRADRVWRRLPILVLSGHSDGPILQQFFRAQANDFLTKPISGKMLLKRVLNCLDRVPAVL